MPNKPRGRPFEEGNPGGPGAPPGSNNGGGPIPNEFREWLKNFAHTPDKRERMLKILSDAEDAEEKVTDQGVCVPVRAKAKTYLEALELIWGYAEGKPMQSVKVEGGENLGPIRGDVEKLRSLDTGQNQEAE